MTLFELVSVAGGVGLVLLGWGFLGLLFGRLVEHDGFCFGMVVVGVVCLLLCGAVSWIAWGEELGMGSPSVEMKP